MVEYVQYFLLSIVFLLALAFIMFYLIYFWYSSYFAKLPTYGPIRPLVGIVLDWFNSKDLYHDLLRAFSDLGQTVFSMAGPQPVILTTDPKFIEFLLTSKSVKKSKWVYSLAESFLGKGLATSDGDNWKMQRKILTPAFHYNILQRNVEVFNDHSDSIIKSTESNLNGCSVDAKEYAFKFSLGVVYENTIGISYNTIKTEMPAYIDDIKNIVHILYTRLINPLHYWNFTYRFTKNYRTEKRLLKNIHGLIDKAIDMKKQTVNYLENSNINEKPLLLDLLLKNSQTYHHQLLREEVSTIIYAGTDTTATTLSYTIYMLANNPEVQERVFNEMFSIHQELAGKPITFNEVCKMKYLHLVLLESLRLCGTVPFIAKEFAETTVHNGITYPKGIPIIIVLYALHRDARHYIEPDKFIPERHLYDNTKNMEPFSYLPFSGGPRNCIGQRHAIISLKVFIYKFLLKYELLPVQYHKLELQPEIIMLSKNGFKIQLRPRILNTESKQG